MVNGLDPILLRQIQESLLHCGLFRNMAELQPFFVDKRLFPWKNQLPIAENTIALIRSLVAYLYTQSNQRGENLLSLFLLVLSEQAFGMWQIRLAELAQDVARQHQAPLHPAPNYQLVIEQVYLWGENQQRAVLIIGLRPTK